MNNNRILNDIIDSVQILDSKNIKEYKYITDILNSIFGNNYGGWMKATWPSNNPKYNFRVWFPQLAIKDTSGKDKAATFDCINTISDDWQNLTYIDLKEDVDCTENPYLGYDLIFAKDPKGNYIFRGVFMLDTNTLTKNGFTSRRIATKVKLIGKPVNSIELIEIKSNNKNKIRIKTELMLDELLKNKEFYDLNFSNKKNTVVLHNNRTLLDIYYRQNEIRINIKDNSDLMNIYKLLLNNSIAFQKESADPYATKGQFSFFVNENDIKVALIHLLLTINDAVEPKLLPDGRVVCGRCNYIFYKARRCPNCGQLIKYGD